MSYELEQIFALLYSGQAENIAIAEQIAKGLKINLPQAIKRRGLNPFGICNASDFSKTEIDARGKKINDLSPLAGLTRLGILYLQNNQIADISPLAGLTRLWALDLRNNQIADISPLAGLAGLEVLYLQNNQIADISPLAGLAKLSWLYLKNNQITK